MPDLLAHAFIAYAIGTILTWRYEWLTPQHVTVIMAGAFIPDFQKIRLLVKSSTIQTQFAIPFNWSGQMTLLGIALSVLIGVALVAPAYRRRVAFALTLGAATHVLMDNLLATPTGRTYAMFFPVTQWRPPTPGLYLSTDPTPTVVTAAVAFCIYAATRYKVTS
jgi:hypothetical protein